MCCPWQCLFAAPAPPWVAQNLLAAHGRRATRRAPAARLQHRSAASNSARPSACRPLRPAAPRWVAARPRAALGVRGGGEGDGAGAARARRRHAPLHTRAPRAPHHCTPSTALHTCKRGLLLTRLELNLAGIGGRPVPARRRHQRRVPLQTGGHQACASPHSQPHPGRRRPVSADMSAFPPPSLRTVASQGAARPPAPPSAAAPCPLVTPEGSAAWTAAARRAGPHHKPPTTTPSTAHREDAVADLRQARPVGPLAGQLQPVGRGAAAVVLACAVGKLEQRRRVVAGHGHRHLAAA